MGVRWYDKALELAAAAGSSRFERDCQQVLASIPKAWTRARDVQRRHRRFRQKEFDEIIGTLQSLEDIEINAEGGSPWA
jgi:hypothetical protein